MNGLNTIIDSIIQEATQKSEEMINNAREEIRETEENEYSNQRQWQREYESKIKKQTEAEILMRTSQDRLNRRAKLTKLRSDFIDLAIEKAKLEIKSYPTDKYFDVLLKIFENNLPASDGIMYMSQKDLDRMPEDFVEKCGSLMKNGTLTLSATPAEIDGGFIIESGRIYENCSIDSLFEDNESIRSAVSSLIEEE